MTAARDRIDPAVAATMTVPAGLRGAVRQQASLARHTSWRVGGPADLLFSPVDADDLAHFLEQLPGDVALTVLGLGSNVLIRDGGVRGAVILMHDMKAAARVEGDVIEADAGIASPKLARLAAAHGLVDAAFLAGIPGTLGGALAMNAGCHGDETWAHVMRVTVMTRKGRCLTRGAEDYDVGYRQVRRKHDGNEARGSNEACDEEIFIAAALRFSRGDSAAVERVQAGIRELLAKRRASQPLELPNAGSVFRNPPGDYAARLIEACGLKGRSVGGAAVSDKHANFIVNPQGAARAADIETLIGIVRDTVEQRTGIRLETEVKILGDAA